MALFKFYDNYAKKLRCPNIEGKYGSQKQVKFLFCDDPVNSCHNFLRRSNVMTLQRCNDVVCLLGMAC